MKEKSKTEDTDYALNQFEKAVKTLQKGVKEAKSELETDGVIKRFEYTFELLWKTLKIVLYEQGHDCNSPKECMKIAFRKGLINNETIFLEILEARNLTTHTYSNSNSGRIFIRIKNYYLSEFETVLKKLKKL